MVAIQIALLAEWTLLELATLKSNRVLTSTLRASTPTLMAIARLLRSMAAADRPTTITIRSSTRHLLESIKRPGETYDELILELAEEFYPPSVINELKRRVGDIHAGRVKPVATETVARRWGV